MKFSVIIPALNEAQRIGTCIAYIRSLEPAAEIIVADGGSTDGTRNIALAANAVVVDAERGRGIQCREGATRANGDILLFLHADTTLPPDAFSRLRMAFGHPDRDVATFRLRFDHGGLLFRMYEFFTRFDSLWTSFGDQCIVVRRSFYNETGGFPSWKIFEDVEFLRIARRRTRIYSIPASVTTSSRKFLTNGIVRQQFRNFGLIVRYLCGTPHQTLWRMYYPARSDSPAAILFVKYPHPGAVKTRLAGEIGEAEATAFYRACASRAAAAIQLASPTVVPVVFCSDSADIGLVREWLSADIGVGAQDGNDLGARMANAIQGMLDEGHRGAMIVGSDVPELSPAILTQAAGLLATCDIVLGPSPDGGYYLIGMNRLHRELFVNIAWSTSTVFSTTIERIRNLGLTVALLPELSDVDTLEDFERLQGTMFAKSDSIQ